MLLAILTGAAVASHHFFAIAAKQLCCEQIFVLCPRSGGGLFVFLHLFLYPLKQLVIYNPRHTAGCFRSLIGVYTNIALVLKHFA